MFKKIISVVFLLTVILPVFSQAPAPAQKPVAPPVITAPISLTPITSAADTGINKVEGLVLPADQTVKFDEGFITLKAECKGDVKWLVISPVKVKYFTLPQGNTIVISIPPQGGNITVFAIGLVDGKLTDYARTNVLITGAGPTPTPIPVPNPPANVGGSPYHFSFIVDLNNNTPDLAQILNSQAINQAITSKGSFRRVFDIRSPVLKDKRLDTVVQQVGGGAVLIIQNSSGAVVDKRPIPRTEAEVLQLINALLGGQ